MSQLSPGAWKAERLWLAHIAATLGLLAARDPDLATETGGSNYPICITTIVLSFVVEELGFALPNDTLYYTAERLNNVAGGRSLPTYNANANAIVEFVRLYYAQG